MSNILINMSLTNKLISLFRFYAMTIYIRVLLLSGLWYCCQPDIKRHRAKSVQHDKWPFNGYDFSRLSSWWIEWKSNIHFRDRVLADCLCGGRVPAECSLSGWGVSIIFT